MMTESSALIDEVAAHCPYCGAPISLLIDRSAGDQHYIEDCEVCCRPIQVVIAIAGDDRPELSLYQENEIP